MRVGRICCVFMISCLVAPAIIIDRIAVVVGNAVIKDSDIDRDVRIVSFLNRQKLNIDLAARKEAANRLIDQSLIQLEIDVGDYQTPPESDANKLLADTRKERAPSTAMFSQLLAQYGLSTEQLKNYLYWQLTVLRFIDQRFRPSVLVTDEQIQAYYKQHLRDLGKTTTGGPPALDKVQSSIRDILTNEQINKQFDSWIRLRRRAAGIQYREASLK